jgi:excisionase family DNA binding protein
MPRYRLAPLTVDDIWQDGPPVRMRDLEAITGLSRVTLRADIQTGRLPALRRLGIGHYLVKRADARAWLAAMGYEPTRAAS